MNILIVGNGFDLAHGLPTTYTDFLNFMNAIIDIEKEIKKQKNDRMDIVIRKTNDYGLQILENQLNKWFYDNEAFPDALVKFLINEEQILNDASKKNKWLSYFNQKTIRGKNWIAFESEISGVVKSLEGLNLNYLTYKNEEIADLLKYFEFQTEPNIDKVSITNFIKQLLVDLNLFVNCLEEYMLLIDNISNSLESSDIKKTCFNKVLSFNYTNTYKKIYGEKLNDENFDFIHGKAGNRNLVLGAEETLENEKDINNEISCIRFKKYFQRIYKKTGLKYKGWVDKYDTDALAQPKKHCIYIFGHSLDITDKDILHYIITRETVAKTIIFYHDEDTHARQIANLVKVLGKDEMIQRTGAENIIFKQQQPMLPV